jgi:glycine cleavage system H protein
MKKFLSSHEWASLEQGVITVGISNHAQDALSDVVFVDLPSVGKKVTKEKSFMAVESVKAASDIYAPMSGEVIAVNEALKDSPEKVNQDAEGEGWLVKIRVSDEKEFVTLLDENGYKATLTH